MVCPVNVTIGYIIIQGFELQVLDRVFFINNICRDVVDCSVRVAVSPI